MCNAFVMHVQSLCNAAAEKEHSQNWKCTCSCSVSKFIPRIESGEKTPCPILIHS